MLSVTPLGHATLVVRGGTTTLLCDPIFADRVSGGGNLIDPPRRIDERHLGRITGILLTHHHSDHFDAALVARLANQHDAVVLAPTGSPIHGELSAVGVTARLITPGQTVQFGDIAVLATPSAAPFAELGYAFERQGAVVLDLCDSILDDSVVARIRTSLAAPPDLVLAPFQAGGYMSFLPLRIGGPPLGLVHSIADWADEATRDLVRHLRVLRPREVVPFADGIAYEDVRINAWHFPLDDEAFMVALAEAGLHGALPEPGMAFEVTAGVVRRHPGGPIIAIDGLRRNRRFEPSRSIGDDPLALVPASGGVADLKWTEQALLAAFGRAVDRAPIGTFDNWGLDLVDESGTKRALIAESIGVAILAGTASGRRRFGMRLNRRDACALISGQIRAEWIELSGAFRYWSDPGVRDLEAIRDLVLRPFRWLENAAPAVPTHSAAGLEESPNKLGG